MTLGRGCTRARCYGRSWRQDAGAAVSPGSCGSRGLVLRLPPRCFGVADGSHQVQIMVSHPSHICSQKTQLAPGSKIHIRRFQRPRELELLRLIQPPDAVHQLQPKRFEEPGEGPRLVQSAGRELCLKRLPSIPSVAVRPNCSTASSRAAVLRWLGTYRQTCATTSEGGVSVAIGHRCAPSSIHGHRR